MALSDWNTTNKKVYRNKITRDTLHIVTFLTKKMSYYVIVLSEGSKKYEKAFDSKFAAYKNALKYMRDH